MSKKKMEIDTKLLTAVFAALFAISESLGLNKKIKESSIAEVIGGFVMKLFGK